MVIMVLFNIVVEDLHCYMP